MIKYNLRFLFPSDAKKTLPRPKVGDFCSVAMEQAFSDACVSLCMGQSPVPRLAQTCRAAAIEMPRPTIRKWCEHGYTVSFQKTVQDLSNHFSVEAPVITEDSVIEPLIKESEPEPVVEEPEKVEEIAPIIPEEPEAPKSVVTEEAAPPKIASTVPVTLDDQTYDLPIYERQSPEDAVVVFCREHQGADVSGCIRQLLPSVLERLG